MTRRRQCKLLEAFRITGTVTVACTKVGIPRRNHYQWLADDQDYATAFRLADEEVTERLTSEAIERATVGAERGVYYKGTLVDTVRDKSDILLIFLLKARRPDLYRDHYDLPNRPMSLGDAATADLIAALPDDKLAELREATDKMRQIVGGQVVVGG